MKHLHIICLSLLFYGLLGFVSCSSDTAELLHEGGDDRDIFLTFRTAVAGASTRAGEDNGDDCVGTLRIVIVSKGNEEGAEWTVEHNSMVSPTTALPQMYSFKVEADSRKRIYLIANEGGLVDAGGSALDFSDASFIPRDGNDKAAVYDYVFGIFEEHPYTPSALPMTAMYEFDVPAVKDVASGEFALSEKLYLVRAATKFSFEFTNQSQRQITVTGIDVEQVITDRMYLMPHVNTDEYWVVVETGTDGVAYSKKVLKNQDWVDWMEEEVKKSKEDNDDEWLTDYEIPTDASATKHEYKFGSPLVMGASTGEEHPKVEALNAFYLPESRTEKTGVENTYKLQEYSITVHTTENGEPKTYPAVTLPHLSSLFRNTHVVVGAIFTGNTLDWEVNVEPYWGIELKPEFGRPPDPI